MATFVKEFENYILSDKREESLISIIPGSEADIYLQITKSLNEMEDTGKKPNNIETLLRKLKELNLTAYNSLNFKTLLKTFDLPETSEQQKEQIIKSLKEIICPNQKLNFTRPTNSKINLSESSSISKFPSELNQELIETPEKVLNRFYADQNNLEIYKSIDVLKLSKILDIQKLNDEFFRRAIINSECSFLIYNNDKKALEKIAEYLNRFSEQNKYFPNIDFFLNTLTLDNIEILSEFITTNFCDKNKFLNIIINKTYQAELNDCENLTEKLQVLMKIYNRVQDFHNKYQAFKSNVLLEILNLNLKLNLINLNLFVEYIKNPVTGNYSIFKLNEKKYQKLISQARYNIEGSEFTNTDENIIKSHLEYFFLYENLTMKEFEEFLEINLLKRYYYQALIQKGEETEEAIKFLGQTEYGNIVNKSEITICKHNKDKFDVDEDIVLFLDLKNIQTLFIKMFEINTENYYYNKKAPIDTAISLEGLVACSDETFIFNEKPQLKKRKDFKFPSIPKKRGLYIIEFIGGGYSSRAIIKKGNLSIIKRETSIGNSMFILNEKHEICKPTQKDLENPNDEHVHTTGIWFKGVFHSANKDGLVIIPHGKVNESDVCIINHDGFSEIGSINILQEQYFLDGQFYVNHESLTMGNTAKFIFKGILILNGREVNFSNLKNGVITTLIYKTVNGEPIPISQVFDKVNLSKSKEYVFELQIPPKLQSIQFSFEAEIFNKSKQQNEKVTYRQTINISDNDESFIKMFLRRTNGEYNLFVLGKNGEPKEDCVINLHLSTIYVMKTQDPIKLQTNSDGRIKLGKLENISKIVASLVNSDYSNVVQRWDLNNTKKFIYPSKIDKLEKEKISLPVSECDLENSTIYLIKVDSKEKSILSNCANKLSLVPINSEKTRFNLELNNLEKGTYVLTINTSTIINIDIHKGKYWDSEDFIITKDSIIENTQSCNVISISDIKINQNSDEIILFLQNCRSDARIHVYAYQFLHPSSISFLDALLRMYATKNINSENQIKKWNNFYLDNRKLSDEIQYVFDRKNLERFMGNSLEKPSLLLKRKFVRDTVTDLENLQTGTEYQKKAFDMYKESNINRQSEMLYQTSACPRFAGDMINSFNQNFEVDNIYNDPNSYSNFNNFLCESASLILNQEVKDNQEIKITNLNLNSYSHLQIVCVNNNSCYEELISLNENKIEKRDLTLKESLLIDKSYAELRISECFKEKNILKIDDITSTSYKILDSLEKVVSYKILVNKPLGDLWNDYKFLLNFDDLSEQEKKIKITKYFSHELNVFLFFKYPNTFEKYILPILKYKSEKTFLDFFLMNDKENILKFISPQRIDQLNILEKCLLIYSIRDTNIELAKELYNLINSQTEDKNKETEIKKYFDILMNMKNENENLNDDIMMDEEESYACQGTFPEKRNLKMCQKKFGAAPKMEAKMMLRSAAPNMMVNNFAQFSAQQDIKPYLMMDKSSNLFSIDDNFSQNVQDAGIRKNFDIKAGKSKEFCETHFLEGIVINKDLIQFSKYWADLALYWTDSNNNLHDFLSKNIILQSSNISDLIFTLAVLDLPMKTKNHTFTREEEMGLKIVADSNLILFTKRIKESNSKLDNDIMIAQSVYLNEFSDDLDNKAVTEFLPNKIYCHKTNIINLTPKQLNFDILIQIPQGSIPVKKSDYTKTINQNLNNNICEFLTYFYFPSFGLFYQYPPTVSIEGVIISKGIGLTYSVVEKPSIISAESLDDVLETGSKEDILLFFSKQKTMKKNDLQKIYWILQDKNFFLEITSILRKKGIYDENIWKMGLLHNHVTTIREFIETKPEYKDYVGSVFNSSLLTVDDSNNYNIFNHLDYHPLLNARVHKIGNQNKLSILNRQLKNTYETFIINLLGQSRISSKDYIRLTYYLILQDRIDEANRIFKKINQGEFNKYSSMEIQYDYLNAYLDFSMGFPEFSISRILCKKYKEFPLEQWRELFEELEDQLIEFDGKTINDDIDSIIDEDKKKKINVKNAFLKEPKLFFNIENKNINITYNNLDYVSIKFYLIDLEVLFSRTPFFKQNSDDFSFVLPNFSKKITLENSIKEQYYTFEIPKEYEASNIMIEISSLSVKSFDTYFSTSIKITFSESLGEVKVTDKENKCLNKVYVKCFAKMKDDSVKFYKDGYTDMRGKFNYITLNTDSLGSIVKFSLFVMDDNLGSAIKECSPPPNLSTEATGTGNDYDKYMNYRQEVKSKWRLANKI